MVKRKEASHTSSSKLVTDNEIFADNELLEDSVTDTYKDGELEREEQNTSCR